MSVKENKRLKASFELPEDISFEQLETYENTVMEIFNDVGPNRADAVRYRAALTGAFRAGMLSNIVGGPQKESEIVEAKNRREIQIRAWMADEISRFIIWIKNWDEDPN